MTLEEIVRDRARQAEASGLTVARDTLGVSISFPPGSWYVNPEEDGVYLQEHEAYDVEAEVAALEEQLPGVETNVLWTYAAAMAIDF